MTTCYFCKGLVRPGRVDYMAHRNEQYVLVKGLPVELCSQCGEVYLDDAASRQIDLALSGTSTAEEHLEIPVFHSA